MRVTLEVLRDKRTGSIGTVTKCCVTIGIHEKTMEKRKVCLGNRGDITIYPTLTHMWYSYCVQAQPQQNLSNQIKCRKVVV